MEKKIQFFFSIWRYLSLGVNFLRNSFKISDTRKTEFFELVIFERDQETWQK